MEGEEGGEFKLRNESSSSIKEKLDHVPNGAIYYY